MTTIDKLGISGIRSFDPQREATIRFFKPLTIILGHNGAGKTTIIECIKMVCTGEFPPNVDKGGAFIHDPKITSDVETKAKIRMQFTELSGRKIVVNRQFQVTSKANKKQEFKTVEQSLQYTTPEGERQTVSHRCTDINKAVPELMGVSKAIMDNVIFVHQEDSFWPLADGKRLKEKFDDIFASTRYTKALDSIRKERKEMNTVIRQRKVELTLWKDRIDQATAVRRSYESVESEDRALSEQVSAIEADMLGTQERLEDAGRRLMTLRNLREQVRRAEARHAVKEDSRALLYSELEDELEDADEDLLKWQSEASEKMRSQKAQRELNVQAISDAKTRLESLNAEKQQASITKGRLEAELQIHERNVAQLATLKARLAAEAASLDVDGASPRLALASLTAQVNDDQWSAEMEKVRSVLTSELDELRADHRRREREGADAVSRAQLEYNRTRDNAARLRLFAHEKRAAAQQKREEIRALNSDDDSPEALLDEETAREHKLQTQLTRRREEIDINTQQRAQEEKQRELQAQRRLVTSLRDERSSLGAVEEGTTRIALRREQLDEKRRLLRSKRTQLRTTAKMVLGRSELSGEQESDTEESEMPSTAGAADDFATRVLKRLEERDKAGVADGGGDELAQLRVQEAHLRNATDREQELKEAIDDLERQARQAQLDAGGDEAGSHTAGMNHHGKRKAIDEDDDDGKDNKSEVGLAVSLESADAEGALSRAEEAMTTLQDEEYTVRNGARFLQTLAERAKSTQRCPTCERTFDASSELRTMTQRLESRSEKAMSTKLPPAKTAAARAATKLRARRRVLVVLQQRDALLVRLRDAQQRRSELHEAATAARELLSERERWRDAQGASRVGIGELRQDAQECVILRREVQRLTRDLDAEDRLINLSEPGRTLSVVDKELSQAFELLDQLTSEVERLQRAGESAMRELNALDAAYREQRERVLALRTKVETSKRLRLEVDSLLEEALRLDDEAVRANELLAECEQTSKDAEAEQHQSLQQMEAKEQEKVAETSSFVDEHRQFMRTVGTVAAYVREGKDAECKVIEVKLASLERDMTEQRSRIGELEEKERGEADNYRQFDTMLRNITDNLRYRAALKDVEREAEELSKQRDEEKAMLADDDVEKRHTDLEQQWNTLNARRHTTEGKREAVRSRLSQLKEELERHESSSAQSEYRKKLVELRTGELANDDLDKYHRALDQALMTYHTLKMEEINKSIRELWQATYQGHDIDYIEIDSDVEAVIGGDGEGGKGAAAATASAAPARRNYNYRVTMRRGDALLDMRGRCSAGQKVLACLVIRLALAESFALDCGILALDEPTTNLDRQNMERLAASLADIVRQRRDQSNFQLILITHDEEFIELLGSREITDSYWCVYKDENGSSRINEQSIVAYN